MSQHRDLLAEKRTHLAEKRTELAQERTLMSFLRTGTTVILFGIAFYGFSDNNKFLQYAGIGTIVIGVLLIIISIRKSIKHTQDIYGIKKFFARLIKHKLKK